MKVELELPELPGYEYTGQYRPFEFGEFFYDKNEVHKATWNSSSCYPIMKAIKRKEKPKIVLYQWLVNHNTNLQQDTFDCGYRVVCCTEDHMVAMCKEFGWTCKKFNPSPLWSLDGDTL
jgi:hypothetical protein